MDVWKTKFGVEAYRCSEVLMIYEIEIKILLNFLRVRLGQDLVGSLEKCFT